LINDARMVSCHTFFYYKDIQANIKLEKLLLLQAKVLIEKILS
jgi:hypothetical protein